MWWFVNYAGQVQNREVHQNEKQHTRCFLQLSEHTPLGTHDHRERTVTPTNHTESTRVVVILKKNLAKGVGNFYV
jgi:hypothetical protein